MKQLSNPLPSDISFDAFDAIHDDIDAWRELIAVVASAHSSAQVTPIDAGTVLVALVGDDAVIKLYPPFLRDHYDFETAALERVHGRLSVPTPRVLARGAVDGWPYFLMTRIEGEPLTGHWAALDEERKCELLRAIGRVASQVHALPAADMQALSPRWSDFVERQREGCRRRQERTGLPAHLLAQLDAFIAGELPSGEAVILTGEYTPMNLMYADGLVGMYDFGDGLVGPAEYDWLGPLCFLVAGSRERREAFFEGYGRQPEGAWRERLLRMLLLHRYSNLKAQVAVPGWQSAADFQALAALIWR